MWKVGDLALCIDDGNERFSLEPIKKGRTYIVRDVSYCCSTRLTFNFHLAIYQNRENLTCVKCRQQVQPSLFARRFIKLTGDDIKTIIENEKELECQN